MQLALSEGVLRFDGNDSSSTTRHTTHAVSYGVAVYDVICESCLAVQSMTATYLLVRRDETTFHALSAHGERESAIMFGKETCKD
jgi:hypothetical protein